MLSIGNRIAELAIESLPSYLLAQIRSFRLHLGIIVVLGILVDLVSRVTLSDAGADGAATSLGPISTAASAEMGLDKVRLVQLPLLPTTLHPEEDQLVSQSWRSQKDLVAS